MASTLYMSLAYCLFILTLCQLNLSFAYGSSPYKHYRYSVPEQDNQLLVFHDYLRQHPAFNYQRRSSQNAFLLPDIKETASIDRESMLRSNWLKRDARLPIQSNKRMLCFFHAVNCFG